MTDLEQHIQATPMVDTHEHLRSESRYLEKGPDVLQDLFFNYCKADLVVAQVPPEIERRLDANEPDPERCFPAMRSAWERCRHTGYGEAVRFIAKQVYGMDEITPEGIAAAQERNKQLRQPGQRLRILKEVGNLDHVQIDDFCWACLPDQSGLDFFLYDLSWARFACGDLDLEALKSLHDETGIEITNLISLREAMAALFAKYGPCAIAVKSQHAYVRTLRWKEQQDADAERVLLKWLNGESVSHDDKLCLGDWCLARGVELAIQHNLPFKIHTGYYAGYGYMPTDYIRAGHLCPLLQQYPKARFILMHISYPYHHELVALAKHYPNVYADMCWSWSIDPYTACDFVRRMIHAVPSHKLFAFGGDTNWPNAAVAYAAQARKWLTRALQSEINEGMLTEPEAIKLATRFMRTNQEECFDIAGTRTAIAAAAEKMLK